MNYNKPHRVWLLQPPLSSRASRALSSRALFYVLIKKLFCNNNNLRMA